MTADDRETCARGGWGRKIEARKTEEKPAEPKPSSEAAVSAAPADAAAAPPGAPAPRELPPLESLKGLASEYTEFLRPGVDENLRRSALKKLFADPHFQNFERFEASFEDFTKGEPIPLAMLKTLEHAKDLLFGDEDKKVAPPEAEKPAAEPPTGADAKPHDEAGAAMAPP